MKTTICKGSEGNLLSAEEKFSDKKAVRPCFGITCAAQQRAATGVSLHELMELGGGRAGGREGGEEKERGGTLGEEADS